MIFRNFLFLGAIFILQCAPKPSIIRISQGSIVFNQKSVALGEPVVNWEKQLGPTDTATPLYKEWRDLGLYVNFRKNACGENRVTCVTFTYRSNPEYPSATTHSELDLENCQFHFEDIIQVDSLTCTSKGSNNHLVLFKQSHESINDAFRHSGLPNKNPKTHEPSKYEFESSDWVISLETDSLLHITRLSYCLSSEKAYLVGLERSPEEAQAFVKAGSCESIPKTLK